MKVQVLMFAAARQLAGREKISLTVPDGCTVEQLREQLAAAYPDLAALLPHVLFAVGSQYVDNSHMLAAVTEIACIPPVSGG